jgi:uncharacterized integral membrane protein (TIGR00698 family)
VSRFAPGIALAALLAAVATLVSSQYGGPQFLYALLFGMAFNFLAPHAALREGIQFTARTILRLGVGLLGARIAWGEIASLGVAPALLIVVCVAATIGFGAWAARALRRPAAEGVLTGGAVAICGASAALAIAAVLPRTERSSHYTLITVVGVTALSTLAMIVYPIAVPLLGMGDAAAGIFLGGTIHDVAQVVGAGYMISPEAGITATYVKLLRVMLLVPVVLALSLAYRQGAPARTSLLPPWFLIVFIALLAVNSAGAIPPAANEALAIVSRACLVAAIAALGVMTSFGELAALGWRPIALLGAETAFLAVLVVGGLRFLGVGA